jgi:prevent-host-death family protein
MKSMSAREAKNGFGMLVETARAEPVTIRKHGRPGVVVLASEEYDRLLTSAVTSRPKPRTPRGTKRAA